MAKAWRRAREAILLTGQIDWSNHDGRSRISGFRSQAKWAGLLDEVERVRTVRITRHGKTIARVVPEAAERAAEVAEAVERLKALREKTRKTPLAEILASRHEGHKY